MVSRFEALLQCYQEHCVARSATMLHLHGSDELSMQEVSKGDSACIWFLWDCWLQVEWSAGHVASAPIQSGWQQSSLIVGCLLRSQHSGT